MKHDGLDRYREKRDFGASPEPRGNAPKHRGRGLRYYIQKHAARALHYDFRLEMDGVLHSWAVPKGPSTKVGEKRLAVEVEDHPLEYGRFEGIIPKGHYGAGTVEVWDQGIWLPEDDPKRALARGRLTFRLDGTRLKGVWSLVRMRADDRGRKVNWLLIRSRKDQISGAPEAAEPAALKPKSGPGFIKPELASLVDAAPPGDAWIHELKFDGYRLLAEVDGSQVRLLTRTGLDWTSRFLPVRKALAKFRVRDTVLDGELVVLNAKGVSDFAALQKALSEGRTGGMVYYVFDLLRYKGQDLRELPLLDRKDRLAKGLQLDGASGVVRFTEHVRGSGETVQREACRLGLEGIVSKRAGSPYRSGRGPDWVKVKCVKEQEFVIGGYTDPQGTREGLGALLLGYPGSGGKLIYAGRVGTGFDSKLLRDLRGRLTAQEESRSPYEEGPAGAERRGVHWVAPTLVAQIRFTGWTPDHRLRHPVFQGLREDKPAGEVALETPLSKAPSSTTVAGVAISHPERIVYPEQKLTKLDIARYYETVADRLLPFVAERPLSLLRCPEGRDGACFYQKHWEKSGEGVKTVRITGKSGAGSYPVIAEARGLIRLIQHGALELHPWGSRARAVETPDVCIFDLDPSPEVPWPDLAAAAVSLRERLQSLDLEAYLKTTGGKGLHLVVPLSGPCRWETVKAFSRGLAADMAREHPDRYTATLSKAARKGRIFIDWLRNGRGATAVAPYSTRARPNAPLAMPIAWGELSSLDRADAFTVRTLAARLEKDPWKGYFQLRQKLPKTVRVR